MSEAFIVRNRIELSCKGSRMTVHAAEKHAVTPGTPECTAVAPGTPECTAVTPGTPACIAPGDAGGRLRAVLLAG